jgi:hypothetical protein
MQTKIVRRVLGLSLFAALAGGATLAQAEQVWARVLSATPAQESTGTKGYNVTYEYNGRQYTSRTDTLPGSSIAIDVGNYGVATTSPVAPPSQISGYPVDNGRPDWNNVQAEPGVVVSSGPAPVYSQPVPVYAQPAPVYYGAPVYVQPAYAYPQPYIYPPIGLSLNLGYSRGWGGHGHGRWR